MNKTRPFGNPKQSHENLCSKWTISYHCGESCSSNTKKCFVPLNPIDVRSHIKAQLKKTMQQYIYSFSLTLHLEEDLLYRRVSSPLRVDLYSFFLSFVYNNREDCFMLDVGTRKPVVEKKDRQTHQNSRSSLRYFWYNKSNNLCPGFDT